MLDTSVTLTLSRVAGFGLAVETGSVRHIGLWEGDAPEGVRLFDTAARLGLAPTPGRRVLELMHRSNPLWVVLGPAVVVRSMERGLLQPVPPFIEGLQDMLAIAALLWHEDEFYCVLDPDLLLSQSEDWSMSTPVTKALSEAVASTSSTTTTTSAEGRGTRGSST
jgi:hypothetical protein